MLAFVEKMCLREHVVPPSLERHDMTKSSATRSRYEPLMKHQNAKQERRAEKRNRPSDGAHTEEDTWHWKPSTQEKVKKSKWSMTPHINKQNS